MAICYPLPLLPMNRVTYDDSTGAVVDASTSMWFVFPEEVERRMAEILKPYGFDTDSDDLPNAEYFLGQIEYMCCDELGRYPWAIIFCAAEYPLTDHLLAIRPSRDIRYAFYSMFHPRRKESDVSAPEVAPPLSIMFIFTKASLMKAAETGSPLVREAACVLADKAESGSWVVIDDQLDPAWVRAFHPLDVPQ